MHTLTIKVAKISDMRVITDCIAEKLGLVVVHMDVGTEAVADVPKKTRKRKEHPESKTQEALLNATSIGVTYSYARLQLLMKKAGWAEKSTSPAMSHLIKKGHFEALGPKNRRSFKRIK